MRQLFVLGLLAALGWWLYGAYFADAVLANHDTGDGQKAKVTSPDLSYILGTSGQSGAGKEGADGSGAAKSGADTDKLGDPKSSTSTTPVTKVALDASGQQAFDQLIELIHQQDAASILQGWNALASHKLATELEQQIADALAKDDEFEAMLARLGTHNTFLHSQIGRKFAEKVFEKAMSLTDGEAVAGGTRFLNVCLRGHIAKKDTQSRAVVDRAYAKYRIRAGRWLCDPQNVAGARSYTVVGGDSLNRISARFRRDGILIDEGTIAVLNSIHNKNSIQEGQRLKIPVDPIHAIVEKRSFSLAVYVGEDLLRLYWIGHGKNDKTPVTEFTVGKKKPRPPWTAPDGNVWPYGHPKNILGEYWIQLRNDYKSGFGAHGTPQTDTICTMSSDGCIRMFAADIAELFEILPRGVTVEVRASAP